MLCILIKKNINHGLVLSIVHLGLSFKERNSICIKHDDYSFLRLLPDQYHCAHVHKLMHTLMHLLSAFKAQALRVLLLSGPPFRLANAQVMTQLVHNRSLFTR